jgi:hypothetical protein
LFLVPEPAVCFEAPPENGHLLSDEFPLLLFSII